MLKAMERAAANIEAFHRRQVQQSWLEPWEGAAHSAKITPLAAWASMRRVAGMPTRPRCS